MVDELKRKFARARDRVDAYLAPYGGRDLEGHAVGYPLTETRELVE